MAGGRPLAERLSALARLRTPSRRVRGVLLLVAGVATVVAAVFAVERLELSLSDLSPWPLVAAALLATPATIALNAAELRATAAASGARLESVGWPRSIRTVVLATAANLLPVPAGAALRVQVLHSAGARLSAAAGIQLSAAALWIGVSLLLAGVVLTPTLWGWAAIGAGAVLLGLGRVGVRRTATHRPWAASGWLLAVETATALVQALRLWLILQGLGLEANLAQSLVIGTASPVAAAVGFLPGGIGLAELLSALVAPLAGLAPAAGLLAIAVGRALGLLVTVPVAMALGLTDLVRRTAEQQGTDGSVGT